MKKITAQTSKLDKSFPIAVIVSTFNQPITDALKTGALERLLCDLSH